MRAILVFAVVGVFMLWFPPVHHRTGEVVHNGVRLATGATVSRAELRSAVAKLPVNRDAFVAWIPLPDAARRARRTFTDAETRRLLKPFEDQIRRDFGAVIHNVQFRYVRGRQATILRGGRVGSRFRVYEIREREFDFTEWVEISTAMTGPFLALRRDQTNSLSDVHQKHFQSMFGRNAMLEDMQIEAKGSPAIIVAGRMKWKAPRTHLHIVIVIAIPD